MALPRTCARSAGFTVIEVCVVLGLTVLLASMTAWVTASTQRHRALSNERDLAVALLERARARALANVGEEPHGVRFEPDQMAVFEGGAYGSGAPGNEIFSRDASIQNVGSLPVEVTFSQLAATTASPTLVTLQDPQSGRQSQINVSTEGQITWTN